MLIEVTKTTFFSVVGPLNVHPRSEPDHSAWELVQTRKLIGKSEPGYKSPYGTPKRYWLTEEAAQRAQADQKGGA